MLKPEPLICQGHSGFPLVFVSWERLDGAPFPTLNRRRTRIHGTVSAFCRRQLTKLDVASYKECVAVKEFAFNRRPSERIALRMGG
jgi:hypothetical protein